MIKIKHHRKGLAQWQTAYITCSVNQNREPLSLYALAIKHLLFRKPIERTLQIISSLWVGSLMWPTVYISTVYISDLFLALHFVLLLLCKSLYTFISISSTRDLECGNVQLRTWQGKATPRRLHEKAESRGRENVLNSHVNTIPGKRNRGRPKGRGKRSWDRTDQLKFRVLRKSEAAQRKKPEVNADQERQGEQVALSTQSRGEPGSACAETQWVLARPQRARCDSRQGWPRARALPRPHHLGGGRSEVEAVTSGGARAAGPRAEPGGGRCARPRAERRGAGGGAWRSQEGGGGEAREPRGSWGGGRGLARASERAEQLIWFSQRQGRWKSASGDCGAAGKAAGGVAGERRWPRCCLRAAGREPGAGALGRAARGRPALGREASGRGPEPQGAGGAGLTRLHCGIRLGSRGRHGHRLRL